MTHRHRLAIIFLAWVLCTLCACASNPKPGAVQTAAGSAKTTTEVSQEKDPSLIYGDPELNQAFEEWQNAGYPKHADTGKYDLSGKASWYGPGLNGNKTASGEIFDMYGMTAAHKKLPFGSIVLVTNEANGKSVVVRINDRGPFVSGRVIDVSYGAAYLIDMVRAGVVDTHVDIIKIGDGKRKK